MCIYVFYGEFDCPFVSDISDMGVYVEKVKSLEQENRELQSSRMELMAQVEFTLPK